MEYKLRRNDFLIRVAMKPLQAILHSYYNIHIKNGENIPKEGPALIVPKHHSMIDITLEGIAIYEATGRHANYIMKSMLINRLCEKFGGIPVVRPKDLYKLPNYRRKEYFKKAHDTNDKALDYMSWLYSQNELMVIHPEGERRKGNMKPKISFCRKFIQYAAHKQIPIVPVGIEYEEIRRPRSKVHIRVGKPINLDHDNISVVVEEIYNEIKDLSGVL